MEVTRVIHPIGQGAFYSERIECDDRTYNIVYDCGSGNFKGTPKLLKREIKSYYKKNDVIDILFISHFDNDHINGIKELRDRTSCIRNIVVPLIGKEDFWFYSIENVGFQFFYDSLTKFANSVYKVMPSNENDEYYQLNDIDPKVLSESESGSFEVRNATKFLLRRCIDWCYIPFNYDKKTRLNILKKELVNNGISEKELTESWDVIERNIDIIKKAYKKNLPDGANKTSLILYSGGVQGEYECIPYQASTCCFHPWLHYRPFYFYKCRKEGCLYFGDNDLNQSNLLDNLCKKIRFVIDRVGTIQLPHHGALKNFNTDLLCVNSNIKVFFASFGIHNKYGHPSFSVVEDVLKNGDTLLEITEERNSAHVQIIRKKA